MQIKTIMTTFIKAKLIKSDRKTSIEKYRVGCPKNITEFNKSAGTKKFILLEIIVNVYLA